MTQSGRYASPFRLDPERVGAGDITQGNAVPWQADFLLCRFDDQNELGWWPAQRPDKVMVSVNATGVQRWARKVESFGDMVKNWHKLGVVVPATTANGTQVFVESERTL